MTHAPDEDNSLSTTLFDRWLTAYQLERGEHTRSSDAPFYASSGTGCARREGYAILERAGLATPSNPPNLASLWRFSLGDIVHDAIQSLDHEEWDNEVRAVLRHGDHDLVSTRADMVSEDTVIEIKSMNGYGFKLATTTFRGGPNGPRPDHVNQLALTMAALRQNGHDVSTGVLIYVSMENLSPKMANDLTEGELRRFSAQWTFDWNEDLEPLVEESVQRLRSVLSIVQGGELPPRVVFGDPEQPATALITDPAFGSWEVTDRDKQVLKAGSTWRCDYCNWRDQCIEDGP